MELFDELKDEDEQNQPFKSEHVPTINTEINTETQSEKSKQAYIKRTDRYGVLIIPKKHLKPFENSYHNISFKDDISKKIKESELLKLDGDKTLFTYINKNPKKE